MTRRRIRGAGPLGVVVVCVFTLGLVSAPLRPCLDELHHPHGVSLAGAPPVDHASHTGSHESHEQPEDVGGTGCECLSPCTFDGSAVRPAPSGQSHEAGTAVRVRAFFDHDQRPFSLRSLGDSLPRAPPPGLAGPAFTAA